jgi:hypothetical protein
MRRLKAPMSRCLRGALDDLQLLTVCHC